MNKIKQMKVSGSSPVRELAGSVVKCYDSGDVEVELRAIGASAVNQAVKALATARSIFAQKGLDLYIRPGYDEVEIKGDKRTVIVLRTTVK
jgi:stage V sporulation protein S